jgi:hypothetical protein
MTKCHHFPFVPQSFFKDGLLHSLPRKNPATVITEPLQGVLERGLGRNEKCCFLRKTAHPLLISGVKEVKGDSPEGIGAKRRPLTSEGRQPLLSASGYVL